MKVLMFIQAFLSCMNDHQLAYIIKLQALFAKLEFLGFLLIGALFWVFICLHKGLLNLYQQICVFIIFVSPLTFILETLKLICDESWDLCMFNKLCMLMRVHYAMLHMFDKLCMFMQVHYAMICKFNKLCMFMQVHYAKLCKSNMLCMFIMICKIYHVCCAKFPLSILYAL